MYPQEKFASDAYQTPHTTMDIRISTQTNLYSAVRPLAAQILAGRVLALDPSIGSWSSQPGYAISVAGQEVDSGVIEMPTGATRSRRLYYLRRVLTEQFAEQFDAVIIEDIPTHRFSRKRGGGSYANAKAQVPLHKAVGVIESCFDAPTLFIAPQTWRMHADAKHLSDKERGEPTDELDARVMLRAVLAIAAHAAATIPTSPHNRHPDVTITCTNWMVARIARTSVCAHPAP